MVVGNKSDKEECRQVDKARAVHLAEELQCLYIECSAKTGQHVHQLFNTI